MSWLTEIDVALFHWINLDLVNSLFDGLMPLVSAKDLLPIGFLVVAGMAWKMGRRGLAAIFCLAIVVSLGEALVISPLKDLIGRPRPFATLLEVRLLVGRGGSGSMPSAHAANWFCVTTILALFWRPTLNLTLPCAVIVSFSRVYNGVHYPSDVLVGALLGSLYGAGGVLALEQAWIRITQRSFPKLHHWLPEFLLRPDHTKQPFAVGDEWSEMGVPATELLRKQDRPAEKSPTTPEPASPPPASNAGPPQNQHPEDRD